MLFANVIAASVSHIDLMVPAVAGGLAPLNTRSCLCGSAARQTAVTAVLCWAGVGVSQP